MNKLRRRMRRRDPYAELSVKQLAKLARKKGVKGVPEGWERETIIKKLEKVS